MLKDNIYALDLQELQSFLNKFNFPLYHAQQIFSWVYQKNTESFALMSNLPLALRQKLEEHFSFSALKLENLLKSKDGTEKFLLQLNDGNFIEAVVIPAEKRATACLSTQVGCKYACRFCASGFSGFKKNLSAAEIIAELLFLIRHSQHKKITHIVFMGSGEPLDNYDSVFKAVRIINAPYALNIGARRITISTCGIIPGIKKLAQENLQVELSVSLHASCDKTRSAIMPVNKKYPLKELLRACREYTARTNRQITFEYVLIKGLNSSLKDAQNLSKILKDVRLAKVNLIPSNTVKECAVRPPERGEILPFKDYLAKSGLAVTLRRSRGEDIEAACGQLRLRYEKN